MAIKSSGQLSFTEIVAEFPDTPPHSMSEFYRGGGKVPDINTNVPASGAISFSNFYNAANRVGLTITLNGNHLNYTFQPSSFFGAYRTGITDAVLVIEQGATVWSDNVLLPALTISGFTTGDTVVVINKGIIMGRGGDGGNVVTTASPTAPNAWQGQAGGTALRFTIPRTMLEIDTSWPNSYILGGGGGGCGVWFGAWAAGGGGAGGGKGGDIIINGSVAYAGGLGGAVGSSGSDGAGNNVQYSAGGGGGRIFPGVGGQASLSTSVGNGKGGGSGASGSWANTPPATYVDGASAGAGGGWGAPGAPPFISNNGQLSNYLPSSGNGGSGGTPFNAGQVFQEGAGVPGTPAGTVINWSNMTVSSLTRPATGFFGRNALPGESTIPPNNIGGWAAAGRAIQTYDISGVTLTNRFGRANLLEALYGYVLP